MPDRREPTAIEQSERLIRDAAERAARLATDAAEKAQKLAVERAVRDASVDRDLRDHERHLEAINGSQRQTAKTLSRLEEKFDTQAAVTAAIAKHVTERKGQRLSRRATITSIAGAAAGYGGILAVILASH